VEGEELLRLLVEPRRLAVAGALASAVGPVTSEELAETARTEQREVLEVLGALVGAGLARRLDRSRYVLDHDAWRALAEDVAVVVPPPDPSIGFGMTADERLVLSRFFEGTRLREIPTSRSSRLVVLERLALEFEPGERYPERQVNQVLGRFHPDWSSLRRHLVDEGLLDREANVYWRSGGRVV
jgi:hypothetical protein